MIKGFMTCTVIGIGILCATYIYTPEKDIATTHEKIATVTDSLVVIDKSHDGLIIYHPKYKSIDLVCGAQSPEEDPNAIFCCAAAFTGQELNEFKHSNIAGDHVSQGKYHKGYSYKKGCFVWYKGKWEFTDDSQSYAALKRAEQNNGMGFRQISLIRNGEKMPPIMQKLNLYRALCELDGKLCIIRSSLLVPLPYFIDTLFEAGVTNAIYLDMGGWRHSWYRKYSTEDVTYIHNKKHNYYTNWITFYK